MNTASPNRLFVAAYPAGMVYADRQREEAGDYKKVAFLPFSTLELEIYVDCPSELIEEIREHASTLQARAGEQYQISTSGQSITLGYSILEVQQ